MRLSLTSFPFFNVACNIFRLRTDADYRPPSWSQHEVLKEPSRSGPLLPVGN
jgi:hypothetical protein